MFRRAFSEEPVSRSRGFAGFLLLQDSVRIRDRETISGSANPEQSTLWLQMRRVVTTAFLCTSAT